MSLIPSGLPGGSPATVGALRAVLGIEILQAALSAPYASQALGEAGTAVGQYFSVDSGGGVVTIYLRTSGGSTVQGTVNVAGVAGGAAPGGGGGTVTSVGLSSGTGITVTGASPITGVGSWLLTLSPELQAWSAVAPTAKSDVGHTHDFASIASKPTTLAGYGINDAAPLSHAHTFASLSGKPTTLAGYGITELAAASGASLVGFSLAGAGARTVQAKLRDFASITDFGGVGDDTINNLTAFTAAEASAYARIYLPEGTFKVTSAFNFTKYYHGPGRIRESSGSFFPGRVSQIRTRPATGTGTDYDRYFSADLSRVEPEAWSLGSYSANIRLGLTEPYFESATTPHFQWFTNHSGWSGTSALLTAAAGVGTNVITLSDTTGYTVGQTIGLTGGSADPSFLTYTDIVTITGKSPTTLTVSPVLTSSYVGSGFTRGRVTHGARTMNPIVMQNYTHLGGGDAYGIVVRGIAAYPALATQEHYFFTSTVGIIGGDLSASAPHNYLSGIEIDHRDNGYQTACNGIILNFQRTNAGATRGECWRGLLLKSEGGTPMDTFNTWAGPAKFGLDMVLADFGANQCAIGLAANQRIYFDNTATPDPTGLYTQFGNTIGNTYMSYASGTSRLEMVVDGVSSMTMKYDDVQFKVNGSTVIQAQYLAGNNKLGFYGNPPINKPNITGSRGGNAAMAVLLTALANLGLITDSTTA